MNKNKFDAFKVWNPECYFSNNKDIRSEILKYAILAPNTHNIQPWKIKMVGDSELYLFIDSSRLLRKTDPDLRHIYMTEGAFLENFKIAASHYGYECDIKLLPQGIPSIEKPDEYPIASITLVSNKQIKESELFTFIPKRSTSHAVFNNNEISIEKKEELQHSNYLKDQGFEILLFDETEIKKKMVELLVKAMVIQTNVRGPHAETIKMIRFRNKELYTRKDGFSFRDLGVTGLKLILAENFATPKMANSAFFKSNVSKSIKKMADSAKAFGVIYAPDDSRVNQIKSGQLFCNAYLKSSQLGLSFQPMDHVFQKYTELQEIESQMCNIVRHKNKIPMAIFRIGYSNESYHTPRRLLQDIVIK